MRTSCLFQPETDFQPAPLLHIRGPRNEWLPASWERVKVAFPAGSRKAVRVWVVGQFPRSAFLGRKLSEGVVGYTESRECEPARIRAPRMGMMRA